MGAWAVVLVFYSVLALAFYAATVDTPVIMGIVVGLNALFVLASFAWARWGYSEEGFDLVDEAETAGGDASVGATAASVIGALQRSRAARKEARDAARNGGAAAPSRAPGASAPAVTAAPSNGSSSSGESDESRVSLLSAAAPLPDGGLLLPVDAAANGPTLDGDAERGRAGPAAGGVPAA